jgi:hypothetical protein
MQRNYILLTVVDKFGEFGQKCKESLFSLKNKKFELAFQLPSQDLG